MISPFKFDIVTAERTYHLSSEKEDSILGWVQAIREAKSMCDDITGIVKYSLIIMIC